MPNLTFHNHQQRERIDLKQWQKLKVKHVLHRKLIHYLPHDVGSWPGKATEEMRDFWEQQGSEEFQHLQKKMVTHCDSVRLHCFIRNVEMVKQ